MNPTPPPQGGQGGSDRPGRRQERWQRSAGADASYLVVRDMRLATLVAHYRLAYEQAGTDQRRPGAEFSGFRDGGGRLVAWIGSRPASPATAVEPFKLACRTLAALEVDSVALLAGDELALAVIASADHPSDLAPFIVGLTFGPAGVEPAGTLVPYQLDRQGGTVIWGPARPVRASNTKGLWAEVLAPLCLDRAVAASEATLTELLGQNRLVHNQVILL